MVSQALISEAHTRASILALSPRWCSVRSPPVQGLTFRAHKRPFTCSHCQPETSLNILDAPISCGTRRSRTTWRSYRFFTQTEREVSLGARSRLEKGQADKSELPSPWSSTALLLLRDGVGIDSPRFGSIRSLSHAGNLSTGGPPTRRRRGCKACVGGVALILPSPGHPTLSA
eukprot:scaffold1766_cov401-Prasinococcus_capsulatus_cf.AAC.11